MVDFAIASLLGLIEGLTEFLPVSSTAHLRISEALLGIDLADGYWKMFSIVIQLGAVLCLPIYFRSRLAGLFATFPRSRRSSDLIANHPLTLTILAFVCTAIPAFLFTNLIGKHLEDLGMMAWALLIGGGVMWVVDARLGRPGATVDIPRVDGRRAVWIGLCQTLSAIFPGLSRSMTTITAGELVGLSRATALEFSFLLAIPTMMAATGYELLKSLRSSDSASPIGAVHLDAHQLAVLLVGFAISFIVAWGVVRWLMRWVGKHGFAPFAIYRIVLGLGLLIWTSA